MGPFLSTNLLPECAIPLFSPGKHFGRSGRRPQHTPAQCFFRTNHGAKRQTSGWDSSKNWAPEIYLFLEMGTFRMAPKVIVWRAKDATQRAMSRVSGGPDTGRGR